MGIIYPIYKQFNNLIFGEDILDFRDSFHKVGKLCRYKKSFEFRTKLPKNLNIGDKVYIYEPKKHSGSAKVIGEFVVGDIFKCDYQYGALPFIVYFCRNVLRNNEYAEKFEKAIQVKLPQYKEGYIMKYALDDISIDMIKKYGDAPDTADWLFDKERSSLIAESERVWKWCDSWLQKMGFYNKYGESNYKFAIEITNPVKYDEPKALSEFTKIDGSVVEKAPQGFVYVKE